MKLGLSWGKNMPKVTKLKLVPSGAKLKEVAENLATLSMLFTAFLDASHRGNPNLVPRMKRTILSWSKKVKPEYQDTVKRALAIIEAIENG